MFYLRRVVGTSMSPTLREGNVVLVRTGSTRHSAQDVVVLRHQGLDKIKRLYEIRGNKIFVVGDNTHESIDSRQFGWLDINMIIGKVVWPILH